MILFLSEAAERPPDLLTHLSGELENIFFSLPPFLVFFPRKLVLDEALFRIFGDHEVCVEKKKHGSVVERHVLVCCCTVLR